MDRKSVKRKKVVNGRWIVNLPLTSRKGVGSALTRDEVEMLRGIAEREGVPFIVLVVRAIRKVVRR